MSVQEKVNAIIADALYLEPEEVHANSNLMKDLGAESIDFLDIVFRLEKEFSIKIPKGTIEARARGSLSDDEFAVNGRLTDAALSQLRTVMPEADVDNLQPGLMVRDIASLFTVATFVRLVEDMMYGSDRKVAATPARGEQPAVSQ